MFSDGSEKIEVERNTETIRSSGRTFWALLNHLIRDPETTTWAQIRRGTDALWCHSDADEHLLIIVNRVAG